MNHVNKPAERAHEDAVQAFLAAGGSVTKCEAAVAKGLRKTKYIRDSRKKKQEK